VLDLETISQTYLKQRMLYNMGIQKTSNGKFRVQIQVRGRGRKGATVGTYDEAVLMGR